MTKSIQTPDWTMLDELIFANRKLELLVGLREAHGFPLADAIAAFSERYAVLRMKQPDRFLVTHSDYWTGFYS
jgi:hypothetical protein